MSSSYLICFSASFLATSALMSSLMVYWRSVLSYLSWINWSRLVAAEVLSLAIASDLKISSRELRFYPGICWFWIMEFKTWAWLSAWKELLFCSPDMADKILLLRSSRFWALICSFCSLCSYSCWASWMRYGLLSGLSKVWGLIWEVLSICCLIKLWIWFTVGACIF